MWIKNPEISLPMVDEQPEPTAREPDWSSANSEDQERSKDTCMDVNFPMM